MLIDHAKGRIKTLEEIQDLIELSKVEGPITIYRVGQLGRLETRTLNKDSTITRESVVVVHCEDGILCPGDSNIGNNRNCHALFTHPQLAANYSIFLMNSEDHIREVNIYHSKMDSMISILDDYDWEDDEE